MIAFDPSDVAARICLNTTDSVTAAESMRACEELVAELDPLTIEFEKAAPSALRRGFLVEMLVRLPRVERGFPQETLLASVRPIIDRLRLDGGRFTVDEPSDTVGPSGEVSASFEEQKSGKTVCGAYALYARMGADPFDEEECLQDDPDEEDDLTVAPDDVPRLFPEQLAEMQDAVDFGTSLHVSLVTEAAGLEPGRQRDAAGDLADRIRAGLPGPGVRVQVSDHVSDDPAMSAVGALIGPVEPDPDTPEAALTSARAAVQGILGEHGWEERPPKGDDERGTLRTAVWSAEGPAAHGLARVHLFAGTGWGLFEIVRPGAE